MADPDRVRRRRHRALSALPLTIRFGQWVMTHREFALCRLRTEAGLDGVRLRVHARRAAGGDRQTQHRPAHDRPAVRRPGRAALAGRLEQQRDPRRPGSGCARSRWSTSRPGIWPRAPRGSRSRAYLGGERRPMPVTAIIGYPPQPHPARGGRAGRDLLAAGWRRFKQPIAGTLEETRARLRAARDGDGPGLLARAWTATGCSRTAAGRDRVRRARSRTSGSAGWRTSSRPATPGWSPRSAQRRRCRSRWATSRAARTTPSRCSRTTPSTSPASTSRPTAGSPGCANARADRGARHPVRAAHVRARPLAGIRRARARRADRVGRARQRRRPVRRLAARSRWCATAAWTRCPRSPASDRSTTRPGSRSRSSRTTTACWPSC